MKPHTLRCPLGTCPRCDALDAAERASRCPNNPPADTEPLQGVILAFFVIGVFYLLVRCAS